MLFKKKTGSQPDSTKPAKAAKTKAAKAPKAPKAAKAAKAAPRPGIYAPKPKADIYTAMLGIALFCILVSIVCLWLEMRRYNYDMRARGARVGALIDLRAVDSLVWAGPPMEPLG